MNKRVLLAGVSLVACGVGLLAPQMAEAAACSPSNGTISANCTSYTITGSLGSLTNNATISGSNFGINDNNSGQIGSLTNNGSISSAYAIILTGSTGTINNSGHITASYYDMELNGNVGRINNTGTLSSDYTVIYNGGSIGTITNSGLISGISYAGIGNWGGVIDTVIVESGGTISGKSGISNSGTIGTISNSGAISGTLQGIYNAGGTIGTLTNNGTVSSGISGTGVNNNSGGSIETFINNGTISGGSTGAGINNSASGSSIGTLTNNGTISGGSYAVYNGSSSTLGAITNSGVIAGNIENDSSNDLTINGGSGSTFGTLTGYAANTKGTITNTSANANLVFGSGNLLLNDDINVGGNTVTNSGATLQIGTGTSSTISVTGNYTQMTSGGLVFQASSSSGVNSQLSVSGTAYLNGIGVTISGSNLTVGETFTIVHSGNLLYANESYTVLGTAHLTATDSTSTGSDLIVTLVSCSSCTGGITSSSSSGYTGKGNAAGGAAAGMGPVLDALANSTDTNVQSLLTTIGNMSLAQQKVVLKQLAPTQITPTNVASTQAASPAGSVIEQHELSLLGDGNAGVAAGSEGRDDWVWGQLVGGGSVRASTANQDGSRAQNFGFVVGYDRQVTPSAVLGIAGSVIKSWSWGSDDNSGSLTKLTSYQLLGYGLQRFGQAFVDGQLVYGFNTYDQTRAIGLLGKSAYADYDGYHISAKLGTGYDIPVEGNLVVTPMAGWRFTRATTESYSETGAGAADLSVDNSGVNSLTQDLGVKLSWKTDTAWGQLAPEARVAWAHDYIRGDVGASGSMGGVPFATTSERIARDGVRLNLGANLETSDDTTLRLEYEGELRSDYQSHTGLLKFTRSF